MKNGFLAFQYNITVIYIAYTITYDVTIMGNGFIYEHVDSYELCV